MDAQINVLDRVRRAIEGARARWALAGGHAVSAHVRPRVTVDVDFVVEGRRRKAVERALGDAGFTLRRSGDVLRLLDKPDDEEPVADILFSHLHALYPEVLRTAVEVRYQGRTLSVVSRPALVLMKYLAAASQTRAPEDRMQDATDIAQVVRRSWSAADAAEVARLARLAHAGAGDEVARLVDDLRAGRKVTV